MGSRLIDTDLSLSPGIPPAAVVKQFLYSAFEQFHWFEPRWYGMVSQDKSIDPVLEPPPDA